MAEDHRSKSNSNQRSERRVFGSEVVDRLRASGNVWNLSGGQLLLPRVFGFCYGVKRALAMLARAVERHAEGGKNLLLLGQIIHNPWVNEYFKRRGVRILTTQQREDLENHVSPSDCAVIPAFGVPLEIERRLGAIGGEIVDTSCGDVRRLWNWAEQAVGQGFGILIFGRAMHDETVVTKSRLAAAGGSYLVAGNLDQARRFCDMVRGEEPTDSFREIFNAQATNATSLKPFEHLAQVSQTTMLYDETIKLRKLLRNAFAERFGPDGLERRLRFQPTVCRATQNRQAAAVELCRRGCDLVIVVGGFGSSNTRHLYELAGSYCPAFLVENADAIRSDRQLHAFDLVHDATAMVSNWLPTRRPIRIGVLAGASTPEVLVGQVLLKLAGFIS
ncbi:MAG: hypothetical protein KAU28_07920 [Phycisphaerae bacterium]|nr:hypothetical protein [Phycisphaerae bacterium]